MRSAAIKNKKSYSNYKGTTVQTSGVTQQIC